MFSGAVFAAGKALIVLVAYPVYLKYLGVELYGLWATLSIVVTFASIGRLGIDIAMTKYVAEEYGRNNKVAIGKYFSTAIITLSIAGILMFLGAFPLRGSFVKVLNIPEEYISLANALLPCMVALSVFVYLVMITDGTLRGLGRVDLANYYNLIGRIISIALVIVFLNLGYGIWSLFWGQVIFYIFLGFLVFYTIHKKLGESFFSIRSFDFSYLRKMVGFGGTMTAAQLIAMLLTPFNKAVIARYIGLSEVTSFEIASRVVRQFKDVFTTSLRAMVPEISRLSVSENARTEVNIILGRAMRIVFLYGMPAFAVFFLLSPHLMQLWLSEQYKSEISNVVRIMLVGYSLNLLSVPIYYLLMGKGKVGYCFINHLIQGILNTVLVCVFIALDLVSLLIVAGFFSFSIAFSSVLLIILFAFHQRANLGNRQSKEEISRS